MDGDAVVSPEVSLNYGNFIQVTFDFLIIAVSVFLMVKAINTLSKEKKEEAAKPVPPPPSDEVKLLAEIRDLLKKEKDGAR